MESNPEQKDIEVLIKGLIEALLKEQNLEEK